MTEPKASNIAQQDQDRRRPKPVPLDPLGNSTIDFPDGAVHGGEAMKPGQMDGDDGAQKSADGQPGRSSPDRSSGGGTGT